MTEIWASVGNNSVADILRHAESAEAAGYDGCFMSDSQNIRMECWVALTAAALNTSRIGLGTWVTNPLTRHAAVTASAAATLQEISNGRVVLSLGRGHSALAHLGFGPVPMRRFERYVQDLQGYLRGEEVPFDHDLYPGNPRSADIGYAETPTAGRIIWLPTDQPKVPVNVVATGRKALRVGALHADEVTLAVGADLDVVRNLMSELRAIREEQGAGGTLDISMALPVVVAQDEEQAHRHASMALGELGIWMSLQAKPENLGVDGTSSSQFESVISGYNMHRHGLGGPAAPATSTSFSSEAVEKYAIAGTADEVIERVRPFLELGLKRIVLPPAFYSPQIAEVIPHLKRLASLVP